MRKCLPLAMVVILSAAEARSDGPAKPNGAEAMGLRVELLREDFDLKLDNLPIVPGGTVRIPYLCHGNTGMAKASVRYRVLKKDAPKPADVPWVSLPLAAVIPDEKAGPFDPMTGVFKNTKFEAEIPFYALPADPQAKQVRPLGGGRVILRSSGLIDSKGKPVQPVPGDRIEYCIEVTEIERKGAAAKTARSPIRTTEVMTKKDFVDWLIRRQKEDDRLRDLERKQKNVFKDSPQPKKSP